MQSLKQLKVFDLTDLQDENWSALFINGVEPVRKKFFDLFILLKFKVLQKKMNLSFFKTYQYGINILLLAPFDIVFE